MSSPDECWDRKQKMNPGREHLAVSTFNSKHTTGEVAFKGSTPVSKFGLRGFRLESYCVCRLACAHHLRLDGARLGEPRAYVWR
jgi:hypothetical protein